MVEETYTNYHPASYPLKTMPVELQLPIRPEPQPKPTTVIISRDSVTEAEDVESDIHEAMVDKTMVDASPDDMMSKFPGATGGSKPASALHSF